MDNKVITFGEIILRLTIPDLKWIVKADSFDVVYGGGEASIAVSLINYDINVYFIVIKYLKIL